MNQDPMIVIEQKDENKKRGALAVILAIAFVAILAIGGTFAYLTYTANQTPNRFTLGELSADLLEPEWTNAALTDNGGTSADKDTVKYYGADGVAIPKKAAYMIPGQEVDKNPFIVNTSTTADALGFGAIKVQFQKVNAAGTAYANMSNSDVEKLLKCYYIGHTASDESTAAGFTDLGDDWSQYLTASSTTAGYGAASAGLANSDGAMYFVNKARVAPLASLETQPAGSSTSGTWGYTLGTCTTSELFTEVRFIDTAAQTDIDALKNILGGTTKGWRMVLSGAMIQTTTADDDPTTVDSYWAKNFKTILDAKTNVNNTTSGKPTAASGMRANTATQKALGQYITITGAGTDAAAVTVSTATGVPEAPSTSL